MEQKTVQQRLNEITDFVTINVNAKEDTTHIVCENREAVLNHGHLVDCSDDIKGNNLGLLNDLVSTSIPAKANTYGEMKTNIEKAVEKDIKHIKKLMSEWQLLVNLNNKGIISLDTPVSTDNCSVKKDTPPDIIAIIFS